MKKRLIFLLTVVLIASLAFVAAAQAEAPTSSDAAAAPTMAPNLFRRSLAHLHNGATIYEDPSCANAMGVTDGRATVYVSECAASGNLLQMGSNDILMITFKQNGSSAKGYVPFTYLTYLSDSELSVYGNQLMQGLTDVSMQRPTQDMLSTMIQEFIDTADTAPAATVGPLRFGVQPHDVTVFSEETASFYAKAGDGDVVSYKWQVRAPGSSSWTSAGTGETLRVSAAGKNGYRYRCTISDGKRSITSAEALLTVVTRTKLAITIQPASLEIKEGDNASFSVTATGDDVTYVWEKLLPGAKTWTAISGETASTLQLTAVSAADSGIKFRCKLSDKWGGSMTSDAATLTVIPHPELTIVSQPASLEIKEGDNASFSVTATGDDVTYVWEKLLPGAKTWTAISGETTNTLQLTAVSAADSGIKFRCKLSDKWGGSMTSDAATLTVIPHPELTIVSQPASLEINEDEDASFSVTATGDDVTYVWEKLLPGAKTWTAISGETTNTLQLTAAVPADNGTRFRCKVSDKWGGALTSDEATLTVIAHTELVIVNQPVSLEVKEGEDTSFSVTATGDDITYTWEMLLPNTKTWTTLPNETSSSIQLTAVDGAANGTKFHCKVHDKWGREVTSDDAVLTVLIRFTTVINGVRYTEIEIASHTLFVESYTGSAATLVVLSEVESMPVLEVGPSAFENNKTLSVIDLPDSIQLIGKRAFAGCTSLKEMK